jgi:mannose-6-phosphate isomerase
MHWIESQNRHRLLSSLREIEVGPGDAVFVPPGVPHAIGPGLMIAEVQEPTDFSIVCEYVGYSLAPEDCHLGLGWPVALEALDLQPMTRAEQRTRCGPLRSGRVQLPPEADRFFQVAELRGGDKIAGGGLHVVICTEGRLGLSFRGPTSVPTYIAT